MTSPVPRRERVRRATIEEIKATAREQLAEHGSAALSLRAVARAMGMTPSALYRYFDSRAALISALAQEAFGSLADALEAAFAAAPADSHDLRWLLVARAHRKWAMEHTTEYTLIFGPQPADLSDRSGPVLDELHRSVAVLFRCMGEAIAAGCIDPSGLDAELSPGLRERLREWNRLEGVDLGPTGAAACMLVWTQLHGLIALELFGHLPDVLADSGELYDQQMLGALGRVGLRAPIDFAAVIARADLAARADHTPAGPSSTPT